MSILKREVYFDNTGGYVRFFDWAIVTTTLGSMVEPFLPNSRTNRGNFIDFDPTDEIARIDSMEAASSDKQQLLLSGGGPHHINGGVMMPRVGR